MLKIGSRGPQVADLQKRLKALGYYSGNIDGIFGPITEQAVKKFQAAAGITVDGIVGPQTMAALVVMEARKRNEYPVLRQGSTGQYVIILQKKLKEHGFDPGPIDGIFGAKTLAAVKAFQKAKRLIVDGIVGPQTWAALEGVMPSRGETRVRPSLGKKVCLDPGHGGYDPGAIGPGGTREKDVTLDIALRLKSLLEADGFEVIMTRTGDTSPGGVTEINADLKNRVTIADNSKVDIFVSIHINSGVAGAAGCECYIYSLGGAAEKLARAIQKHLVASTGMANRGVRTANFYVLRNTSMPAVLGETGFISNPGEEKLLQDPAFRQKIAKGYAAGIKEYFGIS